MDISANLYQLIFNVPNHYWDFSRVQPVVGSPLTLHGKIKAVKNNSVEFS
jgi:hypothetical protein